MPDFVAPVAPPPTGLQKDDDTIAMAAHAITFIEGGVLGPLAIYIWKKDTSPFIAFHALQSFYFGLLFFVVGIATCGIGIVLGFAPYLVFELIAAKEANEGHWYRLPIVGNWAWAKHPGPPAEKPALITPPPAPVV